MPPRRHNQRDRDHNNLQNCETQRNLSDEGREMSRNIGKVFDTTGIRVGKVISSPYCRCMDTAGLAFGKVKLSDDLAYAMGADKLETVRLGKALRTLLGSKPVDGVNTVLVGHTANLKEATGIWPSFEGSAIAFQPQGNGKFYVVGEILPKEWVLDAQ